MTAYPALRGARAAVAFLTRIPMGAFPSRRGDWRWAAGWFPAVGAAIGVLLAVAWYAASRLGSMAGAALVCTASLVVTGALHEDGLADTADALGGGANREQILRILKDSRVGSYGALALVASFTIRVTLLASLPRGVPVALIASQCVSRVPPVWLLWRVPYITPEGDSKSGQVTNVTLPQVVLATAVAIVIVGGLVAGRAVAVGPALAVVAVSGASGVACGRWFRHCLGGVTGDLLGAAQQVAELAALVVLVAAR